MSFDSMETLCFDLYERGTSIFLEWSLVDVEEALLDLLGVKEPSSSFLLFEACVKGMLSLKIAWFLWMLFVLSWCFKTPTMWPFITFSQDIAVKSRWRGFLTFEIWNHSSSSGAHRLKIFLSASVVDWWRFLVDWWELPVDWWRLPVDWPFSLID